MMRTITIILLAMGLISLSSCEQKTDPNAMLENSQTRTELFDAIASNHSYMTQFMDNMQTNDHAMQMMQGNQKMMGHMMQGGGMMQMMHENGMMSEDCMESCKKMIEESELEARERGELELSKSQSHGDHH